MKINREPPTGDTHADRTFYKVRSEMLDRYDAWKRTNLITPDQEAQLLAALATAKENYAAAMADASDDEDPPNEREFVDEVSGKHVTADLEAEMLTFLSDKQVVAFRGVGLPTVMFSDSVAFLSPAP